MYTRKKAFTLIELLVVIAIIAIIAAILFPVFAQARAAARKASCLSNFKQVSMASLLYLQDYDETYPLTETTNTYVATGPNPDSLMQTLIVPYSRNDQILACPGDPASVTEREWPGGSASLFPQPTTEAQRRFNLAGTSNFGVNFQYFGPIGPSGAVGVPQARVGTPAQTIYGVDSIYDRSNGVPYGGGFYAVDPPCRFISEGGGIIDTFTPTNGSRYWFGGWNPSQPLRWNVFGGSWPWHQEMATVAWADGHVKAMKIDALTTGCEVKDRWRGFIFDPDKYLWDLR